MKRLGASVLAAALLFAEAPAGAQEQHQPARDEYAEELQGYVPGASQLEGQIRAPCCWNQTIDIHGSEVSSALKREIRTRLKGGETVDQIRDDIVKRYGERILAVPPGSPLKQLATFLAIAVVLAGAGAALWVGRWRRRTAVLATQPKKPDGARRDEWDDRLDQELEKLEGQ